MSYSVAYTSAGTTVQITEDDGSVWLSDTALPPDTAIRAKLHEWLAAGNTPIPFVAPPIGIDDYRRAIQAHIDATAQAKDYDSGVTCSSYVNSTIPAWAAQAVAFVAWRDAVWAYAFTELTKVEAGQRPQPTVAEIVGELPAMSWPA